MADVKVIGTVVVGDMFLVFSNIQREVCILLSWQSLVSSSYNLACVLGSCGAKQGTDSVTKCKSYGFIVGSEICSEAPNKR